MDLITWHHVGCPYHYQERIDVNGYVDCDCGIKFHVIDGAYNCGTTYHGNRYDPICNRIRLRKILAMLTKVDGYDDNWVDSLETNILNEWDRRKLKTFNNTYY
jgi:hypothetical protein